MNAEPPLPKAATDAQARPPKSAGERPPVPPKRPQAQAAAPAPRANIG